MNLSLLKTKEGYLLGLILVIAIIFRTILISVVPPGLANDEVNIIINAQSLLKTGSNIPGVTTGELGSPKGETSGGIHSELSSYLIIPWIAL